MEREKDREGERGIEIERCVTSFATRAESNCVKHNSKMSNSCFLW